MERVCEIDYGDPVFLYNMSCIRQYRLGKTLITILGERHSYVNYTKKPYYEEGFKKDLEYGTKLYDKAKEKRKEVIDKYEEEFIRYKKRYGTSKERVVPILNISRRELDIMEKAKDTSVGIDNFLQDRIIRNKGDTILYLEYSHTSVLEDVSSFNIQKINENKFFVNAFITTLDNRRDIIDMVLYGKDIIEKADKVNKDFLITNYFITWNNIASKKEYFSIPLMNKHFPGKIDEMTEELNKLYFDNVIKWEDLKLPVKRKTIEGLRGFWSKIYDYNILCNIFEFFENCREYVILIGYSHIKNIEKQLLDKGFVKNMDLVEDCKENTEDYIFTDKLWKLV